VAEGVVLPVPRRRQLFEVHEAALTILGTGTALALMVANPRSNRVFLEVIVASSLYASVIFACASKSRTDRFNLRFRLLASYAFVVWFYCAVARITPALGTALRDRTLLAIDESMFGRTPAVFCERVATARLTDLLSLCYLTYHLYLPVAVVRALVTSNSAARRLSAYLFTGFAVGFAGYLLVPAVGPAAAYPELFRGPLPGGIPARLMGDVVAAGSSVYDIFPSLHVLITCILLDHDWRNARRLFWIMTIPALGMLVSTVYLRYHYGVDILMAFVLFLALRRTFLKGWKREVRSSE